MEMSKILNWEIKEIHVTLVSRWYLLTSWSQLFTPNLMPVCYMDLMAYIVLCMISDDVLDSRLLDIVPSDYLLGQFLVMSPSALHYDWLKGVQVYSI